MKMNVYKLLSKKISNRLIFVFLAVIIAITGPIQIINSTSVFADEYDDRINALQKDIEQYQIESAKLNAEAITLSVALAQITNEKSVIQVKIDINQNKYDQLVVQIAETEKKIKDNQDALGKIIADLYVDDNISPIEMLAGSKNISEYMDKQEYRNSVRNELKSTINKVKDLRIILEKQKKDVEAVLTDQKSQRNALIAKENEQQALIDKTKGDEAEYQRLIAGSMDKIAEARAIQAALKNRSNSTGGYTVVNSGSIGDYRWNDSNCPMGAWYNGIWYAYFSNNGADGEGHDGGADGIGSDGYGCRQCASYVAWKIAKETGYYPYWGDGRDFTAGAKGAPFYGVEGSPHRGSVAVLDAGTFGHVAWVETEPYVNSRGQTVIQVSQYNFNYGSGYGMYSLMELSVDFFNHYVQIKKY